MRFLLANLYALAWVTVSTIRAKCLLRHQARHLRRARELRARISYLANVRTPAIKALTDRAAQARDARHDAADAVIACDRTIKRAAADAVREACNKRPGCVI